MRRSSPKLRGYERGALAGVGLPGLRDYVLGGGVASVIAPIAVAVLVGLMGCTLPRVRDTAAIDERTARCESIDCVIAAMDTLPQGPQADRYPFMEGYPDTNLTQAKAEGRLTVAVMNPHRVGNRRRDPPRLAPHRAVRCGAGTGRGATGRAVRPGVAPVSPKDTALMIGFVAGLLGIAGVLLAAIVVETCP